MASDNLYSHIVTWMKILLPLTALAILSSVVFFARDAEDAREIPFLVDGGPETPGERVMRPEFLGVTEDGSRLIVRAQVVTPENGNTSILLAEDLTGRIETKSGRIIQAASPTGRLEMDQNQIFLTGVVTIDTSDGFHVITDRLTTRLDITYAETHSGIRGDAPFGTLEAQSLILRDTPDAGEVLDFKGDVKLVYEPRS